MSVLQVASAPSPRLDGERLACPLCEYDLRGLSDPRCPECGTRFDWAELRDPAKRLHPYLFEHHPERNVSSFVKTLVGGLRPWKFWATLLPVQPSQPKRLILYALICAALLLPVEVAQLARTAMEVNRQNSRQRARMLAFYTGGNTGIHPDIPPKSLRDAFEQLRLRTRLFLSGTGWVAGEPEAQQIVRSHGSVQGYLNSVYPLPPSPGFFRKVWNFESRWSWRYNGPTMMFTEILIAGMLWPWLIGFAFQIFRATMRRAKIRPTHLLRVAIYSGDIGVWLALVLLVPVLAEIYSNLGKTAGAWAPPGGAAGSGFMYGLIFWAPIVAVAIASIRLLFAVKKYLRFDHAVATVISLQIMVGLALWKLHFIWHGL